MTDYTGGPGDDVFNGGAGDDTAAGNGGNDTLKGMGRQDVLSGGAGSDLLDGGDGNDNLYSGDADPRNVAGPSLAYFFQLPYPPVLDTGQERDTLIGGSGDDVIFAGYGDDVDGGSDNRPSGHGGGDHLLISFMGATAGVAVDFSQLSKGPISIGGGTIQNIEYVNWVQGSDFDDVITMSNPNDGYSGWDSMDGMGGNDRLIADYYTQGMLGGDGSDILDGRNSQYLDTMDGGAGDDTIFSTGDAQNQGGAGNDTISGGYVSRGGDGNDIITNANMNAILFGDAGNDTITAQSTDSGSSARIFGGAGADRITGGGGDDILGSGDRDETGAMSYGPLPDAGLEHDSISGGAGNDEISIGYGDSANGGSGTDILSLSLLGATSGVAIDLSSLVGSGAHAFAGGSITSIEAISTIRGSNYADQITLGGQAYDAYGEAGDDIISGTGQSEYLDGGDGNDTIIGGAGEDTMAGGAGDDRFFVDNAADQVIEVAGQGSDELVTSVSYVLAAGQSVESLYAANGTTIDLTGNETNNILNGNDLAGTLTGMDGSDILRGYGGADSLFGGADNDILDGGAGADTMTGGTGDDTYYIDNAGDTIVENAEEGIDTVYASISTMLAANVDLLVLTGTNAISGTGNAGNNWLIGNDAANTLSSGDGADLLDGHAGADTMIGGTGDDVYYVDNAGDKIVENAGEGIDTVYASVTTKLGANVDLLVLTGTGAINGTGNAGNNWLIGNDAANTLSGGAGADLLDGHAGADTMIGGTGDDVYYVDNGGDVVVEDSPNGGNDQIFSSVSYGLSGRFVETLTLTGTGNISATGNGQVNTLVGNAGNNTLDGAGGSDVLTGGAGSDSFVFDSALGASNIDTIADFTLGADMITLDRSIFKAIGADGALAAGAFYVGTAAHDADDRIIYDSATGDLFYDADGNGAGKQVAFAHIAPGLALASGSFSVTG